MRIKNMNKLAVAVAKREGGKKSLDIAQIKEVLAHLSDIVYQASPEERPLIEVMLYKNGKRRGNRVGKVIRLKP